MRRLLTAIAGTCLLASPGLAQDDTLTGYTGTVTVQGSVEGSADAEVRAYVNGLLAASAAVSVTGSYTLRFDVSGQLDQTVVVWYVPSDDERVPEALVVKESSGARLNGVWGPCIPRKKAEDVILHDVVFKTEKEFLDDLEGTDCFDKGYVD